VVRNALAHHLEGLPEDDPARETFEGHLRSATESGTLTVRAGMADTYREVFREYASALERAVEDPDEESAEAMTSFFTAAFKGVVGKMENATGR